MDPLSTELLPALRQYLALTQPQLAELLGTTRVRLAQVEGGTRPLPPAAQVALAALLAALPAPTLAALALGEAPLPLPATPAAPDAGTLAVRRHRAQQELRRHEAALAARQAQAACGQARLALLAAPNPPDPGPGRRLFELEARQWTDAFSQAELRLLRARCEGLRRELAVLAEA
jgi:transcriptional regulator with XRE-family HTH domain